VLLAALQGKHSPTTFRPSVAPLYNRQRKTWQHEHQKQPYNGVFKYSCECTVAVTAACR
jgi:hypothetical protein